MDGANLCSRASQDTRCSESCSGEGQRRLFVSKTGSLPETTVIVDSHLFPMPVVLPLSYCLEAMKSAYCSDGKNSSLWKYVMAAFVLTESLNKFLVNRGIYKSFIMA